MDIRDLDLNLLVVFDAMNEHRSVTRAAEAVGLSQPAASAALGRLRTLFGDPLFVKSGAEMRPTARAAALAGPVRRVIGAVKGEILQMPGFEPSSSRRRFTLIAPDIAEINLLPRLLERFSADAPQAALRTISLPRRTASDALQSGAADLALGYFPDLKGAGFYQQRLFADNLVCIVRQGHSLKGPALTVRQYLDASHILVRPEGREHGFDDFLRKRGFKRRVVLEIAHHMSLLPIVERSDLVATVPRDLARICARHADIRILPAPIKSPPIEVRQYWHGHFNRDPANVWLRGVVHGLFSGQT